MPGQTNLQAVLDSIQLSCDDVAYGFATATSGTDIALKEVLGTFHENEGLTIFATKDYFDKHKMSFEGPLAKLTIDVHTSLELVGLTAALTAKLTEHGISANVVAAYYHDHIFVQYDQRQKATEAIQSLKSSGSDA
jgi:uncharacterized protein